jgi:hypothetical protein
MANSSSVLTFLEVAATTATTAVASGAGLVAEALASTTTLADSSTAPLTTAVASGVSATIAIASTQASPVSSLTSVFRGKQHPTATFDADSLFSLVRTRNINFHSNHFNHISFSINLSKTKKRLRALN